MQLIFDHLSRRDPNSDEETVLLQDRRVFNILRIGLHYGLVGFVVADVSGVLSDVAVKLE